MRIDQLHTISKAFQEICQGEEPWVALGNFINYWFAYAKDRREALIIDPLPEYDEQSEHQQKWALFCAAGVEWLCSKYGVPCPEWVYDSKYDVSLPSPWFFWLADAETTPDVFHRRNIFCGDNVFANKWEFMEEIPALVERFKKIRQTA